MSEIVTTTFKKKLVAPVLLSIQLSLIKQIVRFCDESHFALHQLEPLKETLTEWHSELLNIFKSIYTVDCLKSLKTQSTVRGLYDQQVAISKSVQALLLFLVERGNDQLRKQLDDCIE
jgi:hypothetical protein